MQGVLRISLNFGRLRALKGRRENLARQIDALTKKIDKDVAVGKAQS